MTRSYTCIYNNRYYHNTWLPTKICNVQKSNVLFLSTVRGDNHRMPVFDVCLITTITTGPNRPSFMSITDKPAKALIVALSSHYLDSARLDATWKRVRATDAPFTQVFKFVISPPLLVWSTMNAMEEIADIQTENRGGDGTRKKGVRSI